MNRHEFSVTTVITSYNKGPWLAEAIDSALVQEIDDHEILVIDDGSQDNTRQVAESFGGRIRYFHQENSGQVAAKNKGVELAQGNFIAFLDGDDRWRATKLSKPLAKFKDDPEVGVVYTDRLKFRDEEIVLASNKLGHTPREGHVTEFLIYDMFVPFSSSMVRKSFLDQVGGMDPQCPIAPDYDLWLRMSTVCKFAYVDEILMEYRTGIDSIGTRVKSKIEYTLKIQEDFVNNYFGGKFPYPKALHRAYANKYRSAGNFYLSQSQNGAAFTFFLKAARHSPWELRIYKSILRSLVWKPWA